MKIINHQLNCRIKSFLSVFLLVLFVTIPFFSKSQDNSLQANTRSLINLLDYLSQDYPNAVKNGKIINPTEYQEMIDFSDETISLFQSMAAKTEINNYNDILSQLLSVKKEIGQRGTVEVISGHAQQIKKEIILLQIIDISPVHYPDLQKGKQLYSLNCQSCHGIKGAGDGPAGVLLKPQPTNFLDTSVMRLVSPLQVFNTTRLGVPETGMNSFDKLSDEQLWQVAFYVKSLDRENAPLVSKDSLENYFKKIQGNNLLSDIAHLSDKELEMKFPENERAIALSAIRLHQPSKNENTSLNLAVAYLDEALNLYRKNNPEAARQKALFAYLDGVEPVENQLLAIDSKIVSKLENNMNEVRSAIKKGKPVDEIEQKIYKAKNTIAEASQLLGEQTYTFWFSFLIAASILLREGLEAVLIIITILSLLRSLNAKQAIKWVHGGWITAVGIGIASWFFTGWLMSFGSQNREILEAVGSSLAVIILLYVGFWLHNKTEAKKWQAFINNRITGLLDQRKMFGLAFISFLVVFREAFESILFLFSLQLQVDDNSRPGIWTGALAAIAGVILIAFLLLRFSARVPLRKLFQYSAIIIFVLAIVLSGQGIHAFQEAGLISVTSLPLNFHSAVLGIFPTVETYVAQIFVMLICGIFWRRALHKKPTARMA